MIFEANLEFFLFNIILCLTIFTACDKNRVFEKNKEIPKYQWASDNKATFTVDLPDTTRLYDIYINIRHVDYYPFSNLWVIMRTTFPDKKQFEKRIEIPLANDDGRWFGESMGDIWDYRCRLPRTFYSNKPGTYTFEIEQDMRKDPLPGIMAIGLRVENTGVLNHPTQIK